MSPRRTYLKESDVKAEVKKILNASNWYWWMPPANGFGKSNVDFNALRGGVFMAIETKFGKNKCTPLQLGFLSSVQTESGFGFVVTEKNIDTFRSWMTLFDQSIAAVERGSRTLDPAEGAAMLNAIAQLTEPYVFAKAKAPDAVP